MKPLYFVAYTYQEKVVDRYVLSDERITVCFSINRPKQNGSSLFTPVSDTDFYALLSGSLLFVLLGIFNKRLFQRLD